VISRGGDLFFAYLYRKILTCGGNRVKFRVFVVGHCRKGVEEMAEKLSKTARASMGDKSKGYEKPCPTCGTGMVATKVVKYRQMPGGMYWICPKDGERFKI
jgi:hypothetical protein